MDDCRNAEYEVEDVEEARRLDAILREWAKKISHKFHTLLIEGK